MLTLEKKILNKIKNFCSPNIHIHEPFFDYKDINEVKNCIKSTLVSTYGTATQNFEKNIKAFTKSKYAVAVINATSGIFLSLKVLGVKSGDEVLVPSLTFVGTVNPISYLGATPHFIDVDNTFNDLDYDKLDDYLKKTTLQKNKKTINKKTKKIIKGIIPVHLFGHPCNMDKCQKLAKKYNLFILEDCSEALGSKYKNLHVGNFGAAGVISFNGNKIITTGGGGVILTNSKKLFLKINHLAKISRKINNYQVYHDEVGFNYKMPSLNASLGVSQLKKIKIFLKKKRSLFKIYKKIFSDIRDIELMPEKKFSYSNFWLQTIIIKKRGKILKNKILYLLNKNKFFVRPVWKLLHQLNPYLNCPKMNLKNSIIASESLIHLPSGYKVGA